jgi:hypothetical protein
MDFAMPLERSYTYSWTFVIAVLYNKVREELWEIVVAIRAGCEQYSNSLSQTWQASR